MLDFNHGANKPVGRAADLTERINCAIDQALVQKAGAEPRRNYLGASLIGKACLRQIQYEYQHVTPDPGRGPDGKTLRIFTAGHAFEDMSAKDLRLAGFDLRTEKANGTQFGFSVAGGKIKGHIDGVICNGLVSIQYPALWEHKALGVKSWSAVVRKGVAAAKPVYAAQVALYQAYMDLTEAPALFTARNRDTQQLYHEPVPFDPSLAQRMSDRAVQVVQASEAGELLPRVATNADHFECRYCPHAKRCWDGA
jgi:hypothetical protein